MVTNLLQGKYLSEKLSLFYKYISLFEHIQKIYFPISKLFYIVCSLTVGSVKSFNRSIITNAEFQEIDIMMEHTGVRQKWPYMASDGFIHMYESTHSSTQLLIVTIQLCEMM